MLKKQIAGALFRHQMNTHLFIVLAPRDLLNRGAVLFPKVFCGLKHILIKKNLIYPKFNLCYFLFKANADLLKCLKNFQYQLVGIQYYSFYFNNSLSSFVSDLLLFDIKIFLNKLKAVCFSYLQNFSFFFRKLV